MYFNRFYFYFAVYVVTENSGSFHEMMCNDERRHKKKPLTKRKNWEKCTYSLKAHTSSEEHTLQRITQNCNINKQNAHYKNNEHLHTHIDTNNEPKNKQKNKWCEEKKSSEKKRQEIENAIVCLVLFHDLSYFLFHLIAVIITVAVLTYKTRHKHSLYNRNHIKHGNALGDEFTFRMFISLILFVFFSSSLSVHKLYSLFHKSKSQKSGFIFFLCSMSLWVYMLYVWVCDGVYFSSTIRQIWIFFFYPISAFILLAVCQRISYRIRV